MSAVGRCAASSAIAAEGCGYHFTDTPLRDKPPAMKALAVLLHGMCGMGSGMIGRVLG